MLALFLAFSETLGKSAQTTAIADNIKASDTWNFFQAKTIRQTSLRIAADAMTVQLPSITNEESKAAITKQIEAWRNTVNRYESDPKEQDGRKELRALAEKFEHDRDTWLAKYHQYEFASAAFQIGIVLASAAVITSIVTLAWLAGFAGIFGLGFMLVLFGAHLAERHRVDNFEMRRVWRQRQVHLVAVKLAIGRGAEVIFHVTGAFNLVGRC